MSKHQTDEHRQKGFLAAVERAGNKLPDPFMLFVYLAVFVIVTSCIVSLFNVSVVHPKTEEVLAIKSLLSGEGIQYILTSMLTNFTGFAPLGLVLAMMIGIGLAERVGLLEATIKRTIMKAPKRLVSFTIVFVGIMGNIASDAAFVIIPPLAAMVYYTIGRHPLAGLAAGFSGVGAGFTANLIINGTDGLLSGISTEAIKTFDPTMVVTPVDNYYFMAVSVFILAIAGAILTDKFVEPRLGKFTRKLDKKMAAPSEHEGRGLRNAGIAGFLYIALLAVGLFWPSSVLRNEDGGLIPSTFLDGIIPIILFFFIVVGITYGRTTGKIETSRDIPKFMSEAMKDMSGYIVLIFAAAQFISYFNWSNLGVWVAVSGANFLQNIGLTGISVILGYIIFTALLNLIIFSGSAKWALEAPIFIPLFAFLGYHPAFVQVAYRIADSSTNIITPMNPYLVIILSFMREYEPKAGLGTLMALMLPYSLTFLVIWIVQLIVFIMFGIPFGPGIGVYLP
ncbi:AbgT family transporter [Sporosarcina limicola]|uniref:Aminobenzoyl-glutamate transport protein n=1 Tax=Sporosarcina limicola TaxID=34101 RepID=A0A927MMV6_9BACL|nr:AbgT family transporter [Sporosarcina limicola]MBE1555807.1 aminobenzoyl-glutamate transport protein [Sporosarcina limicola]